jgi:hypothetical protein
MDDRVEIIETLGRYARALESRDARTVATLFTQDGKIQLFSRYGQDTYQQHNVVDGQDEIRGMLDNVAMPPGRGMHYLTTDHIVDISGDEARLRAEFLIVTSVANPRPEKGWPSDAELMQGTLSLLMIGHYDSQLRKSGGRWLFALHQVKHSLPMTHPPM